MSTSRECTKQKFDTYKQAMTVISGFKVKGNRAHPKAKMPQRAYKCQYCGLWHVTSRKKKKSKKVWR
jgi:hypothetical protein